MLGTDFVVAGGGVVGLATAYHLSKKGSVTVLEKEEGVCKHQSGRNSGVMHSGIYYKPGSLKAQNCRKGKEALEAFCTEHKIPFERCGKVIVATDKAEDERLQALLQRGKDNGIDCRLVNRVELQNIEPYAAGVSAIHVPETGIVSYKLVCDKLVELITANGGLVKPSAKVAKVEVGDDNTLVITEDDMVYSGKHFFNCGGLYSDHIAKMAGVDPKVQIVPFRGEYYTLNEFARRLVRGLIYPVPDPRFPFLGVHFTKMIDGGVECGPNAVLALAREGYEKKQVNWKELWEILTYPGFQTVALLHWKTGVKEVLRSYSKNLYAKSLRKLVPVISTHDLEPRVAGIRAQAVAPDGTLVDDFLIEKQKLAVHVLNAPSPAATACLTIGESIASMV